MPTFDYTAVRPGDSVAFTARIDADTERDARKKIRARGETPVTIKEIRVGGTGLGALFPSFSFTSHSKSVLHFTGQLQRLVRSGITLTNALQVLSSQSDSKDFANILKVIYSGVVERGLSFAGALKEHPKVFSKLYVSMVNAGESTGSLSQVLLRLSDYARKRERIESKIRSALVYPCIMGVVGGGVVIFLLNYLVPKMAGLLLKRGNALPKITEILIAISDLTQNYWWAFLIAGAFLAMGYRLLVSNKKGRFFVDAILLKIPLFGDIIRKACISRFAITLSSLLRSGVKIENALRIVEEVVGNSVIAKTMATVSERIREGESIAKPLEESGVFPKMVIYMISVGESAGSDELQDTLDNIAEDYDHEIEQSASRLTDLLTPLLLLFMAGMVVFIILAVLIPLMDLSKVH
jgi:type II secretory pathway component PulF